MDNYYLDNGIPVVDHDGGQWTWTCPICEHADHDYHESTARHGWFDHAGVHDLVATWPDTSDLDVTDENARIHASEQAAMSDRPMSRP